VSHAVLSLGSNLGDRPVRLRAAVALLRARLAVVAVSSLYETTPLGGPPQPDYLNAVLLVDEDDPWRLLTVAREAERQAARLRRERFGPRSLDVDVVHVPGQRSDDPELTLPHPRAHERAFVLVPWLELDPAAELPGHGPVAALLAPLGAAGVRRRADLAVG
jgi:2-amino-4-hydroxy-6-hydroxymethyldihydropteridine diphosphokinase